MTPQPKPVKSAKVQQRRIQRSGPIQRSGKKAPRKARKTPMGTLVRRLDTLFSLYVRERDGLTCCTCGKTCGATNIDAGHFVGRTRRSLRWDPKNVHSQCSLPCNKLRKGAPREYALFILDRYGADEYRRLMRRKAVDRKWKRHELEALIAAIQRSGHDFETLYYSTDLEATA